MTRSEVMKDFMKKTVVPVAVVLLLFSVFSRIFVENGTPDYFLIWLACGVPFGIGKMFTLIPIGFGISGTVGVVALNLVLGGLIGGVILIWKLAVAIWCALPGFVDSKNEEKTERNAGYLVVSHSGGGMLRQGTRKGIRRTPANRGMRAHRIVKSLDISEDVCHGLCP